MKTKFSKVLVLLAMLAVVISASAVFAASEGTGGAGDSSSIPAPTASEHADLAAANGNVTLDTKNAGVATVSIVAKDALTYYNIEGNWGIKEETDKETTYFSLKEISLPGVTLAPGRDVADPATGKVLWVGDAEIPEKLVCVDVAKDAALMTATYNVDANTPDGTYTVKFTLDVLSVVGMEEPDEETYEFEAVITVSHTCNLEVVEGKDPSCTEHGWHDYYKCTHVGCNNLYSDADGKVKITNLASWQNGDGRNIAKGHNYGEWIEEIPATCVSTGTKGHFHCDKCSANFDADLEALTDLNISVDANAHAWDEGTVTTKPSCLDKGKMTFTCKHNSEHTYTEDIDPIGHTFGEVTEAKPATCLGAGNDAYKQCTECEKYFAGDAATNATDGKDSADAFTTAQLDHSYTGEIKNDGNGAEGTHSFKCVNGCNKYGAAVDHDFENGDCVCGEPKPVTNITVISKGVAEYSEATGVGYSVKENVVTVKYDVAAVQQHTYMVGYIDSETESYVAVVVDSSVEGAYSFTAPVGVEEVILSILGDANLDGEVTSEDAVMILEHAVKADIMTDAVSLAMSEVTYDGEITSEDAVKVLQYAVRAINTLK